MQPDTSAESLAERVRAALDSADVAAISDLLAPDVRWGGPDEPQPACTNRAQVRAWYERGYRDGVRARVTEVSFHGDHVLIGLRVSGRAVGPAPSGSEERWQVLTIRDGLVADIRGFEDRAAAMARAGSPG